MTRTQISAMAIAFSALFGGQALAADTSSLTRTQVKAELAEAVRTGNIVFHEDGTLYNEVFPHNYPTKNVVSKTRGEVKAELAEAINNGTYPDDISA